MVQAMIIHFKLKIFLEIAPHWMNLKGYDYATIHEVLKAAGNRFMHFDEGGNRDLHSQMVGSDCARIGCSLPPLRSIFTRKSCAP